MATNNPPSPSRKVPSFMSSTANSSSKTSRSPSDRTKLNLPVQKTPPKTPTRSVTKSPTGVSRTGSTPNNPSRPPSFRSVAKKEVAIPRAVEMTKWDRLLNLIPKDCEVFPRPKAEKPSKKEDLWALMDKGYHDVPDEPPKVWHILTTMLSYKIRELREKWEVDCPDGLFWVTFKGRKIDPVTKDGKWMVRAKIRKSEKWMHAFLIKNPPTIERDYSLKPTDEVVWAVGDYDYWDVLPDW